VRNVRRRAFGVLQAASTATMKIVKVYQPMIAITSPKDVAKPAQD